MRREIGPGAQTVAWEDRGDHPRGRGLAVGADHVDRAKASLWVPQRGHQPAHPVKTEPHPEQLQREQVALGLLWGHSDLRRNRRQAIAPSESPPGRFAVHPASSSALRRARLSRSPATTSGGALATKPWLASLRSARSISAASFSRRASSLRTASPRSTCSLARISTTPPG